MNRDNSRQHKLCPVNTFVAKQIEELLSKTLAEARGDTSETKAAKVEEKIDQRALPEARQEAPPSSITDADASRAS